MVVNIVDEGNALLSAEREQITGSEHPVIVLERHQTTGFL